MKSHITRSTTRIQEIVRSVLIFLPFLDTSQMRFHAFLTLGWPPWSSTTLSYATFLKAPSSSKRFLDSWGKKIRREFKTQLQIDKKFKEVEKQKQQNSRTAPKNCTNLVKSLQVPYWRRNFKIIWKFVFKMSNQHSKLCAPVSNVIDSSKKKEWFYYNGVANNFSF